jgi:hypothetical protein
MAEFWSIGGSVESASEASTVAWIEWTCMAQRACGTRRWIAPCRPQAVGSGASGRSMVVGSLASIRSRSLARMREKCIMFGLMRNCVPASSTASEKWLATASCMLSRAVQRKAAARSTRSS